MGMALLNESTGKSLHADFDRHYQGYIVKDVAAPGYQRKLLHAVQTYKARRLSLTLCYVLKYLNVFF